MSYALSGPSDYGGLTRLIGDSAGVRQQLDALTQQARRAASPRATRASAAGATASLDLRPQIASQTDVARQHRRRDRANDGGADRHDADPADRRQTCIAQLNDLNGHERHGGGQRRGIGARRAAAGRRICSIPRTAASTSSPARTPPIRRCRTRPHPRVRVLHADFRRRLRPGRRRGRDGDCGDLGDRLLECVGHVAVLGLPVAAPPRPSRSPAVEIGDRASARRSGCCERQRLSIRLHRQLDHRLLHARRAAALATIGSLSSSQPSAGGFHDLVQDTRTSLSGAMSAMAGMPACWATRRAGSTATKTRLADTRPR